MSAVEFSDDVPVCSACHLPAALVNGQWQHAEAADAVFCSIFRGVPLTVTEDDE